MSSNQDKIKHSKRLQKDENVIKKQAKIASKHGVKAPPHSFSKHHAMDCGNPKCSVCSNPRQLYNQETIQEQSHKQGKFWDDN